MNEEKRPGGLTALAILNFVFSGFGVLNLLALMAFLAFRNMIPTDEMEEVQRAQFEAFQEMGLPVFVLIIALGLVSNILLLVAVFSIVGSIVSGLMFAAELGGGFNIATIIGLIYPVVTLILLNTTFRDDLTN